MSKFTGYLKPDLTLGYRPSNVDVENAVFNLERGFLPVDLASRGKGFLVIVGKESSESVWHESLTSAVLSPELDRDGGVPNESSKARLLVKVGSGRVIDVGCIYVRDTALEREVPVEVSAEGLINPEGILNAVTPKKAQSQEFLDELSTVVAENAMVEHTEVWSTPAELRKYLVRVDSPVDIFVDTDALPVEVAKSLSDAMKSSVLPYQYRENGDMVLNPNGAVLTKHAINSHLKGGLHIQVESDTDTLDFLTAVILRLVSGHKGAYKVEETALLYKVLTMGIKKGIYHPLSNDRAYDINKTLEREELRDVLGDIIEGKGLTSLAVLALVIDVIFRNNLFDVQHKGIPKLSDKISRVHFAELFDESVEL